MDILNDEWIDYLRMIKFDHDADDFGDILKFMYHKKDGTWQFESCYLSSSDLMADTMVYAKKKVEIKVVDYPLNYDDDEVISQLFELYHSIMS
jgi:hypothetical protein